MTELEPGGMPLRKHNLPSQPTAFTGRKAELDELKHYLADPGIALITLVGPGGIGKTRLAVQAALQMVTNFAAGVFFVDLAPLTDPGLVVLEIARTLDVPESGATPLLERLKMYLQDKQMLLVLDNFEQVVAAAPLIAQLSGAGPQLKVLVTSRVVLHLRGEKEFAVPPMQLPTRGALPPLEQLSQCEAVRLFIERAREAKRDFEMTDKNAPVVAEICHRLDGLPLAIELAATRIKILTPEAMLSRLEHRLRILTGGARDLPVRQQNLRNTLDWSYALLTITEKKLLRRIAVFMGSASLAAVESICNAEGDLGMDILAVIQSLVDSSLLRHEEVDGQIRFAMLETIREYARERLAETEEQTALLERHIGYYLALVAEAERQLEGPAQREWADRIEVEHDNVRAALHAVINSPDPDIQEQGLRLAAALWYFWWLRGYWTEGRGWLDSALFRSPETPTKMRARTLYGAGRLAMAQNDYSRAAALLEASLTISRQIDYRPGVIFALNSLAWAAQDQAQLVQAQQWAEEELQLGHELGDNQGVSDALEVLAAIALRKGNSYQARELLEKSLALVREASGGDKMRIATRLTNLGETARVQSDYAMARVRYEEALQIFQETRAKRETMIILGNLGSVARSLGNYDEASAKLKEGLRLAWELRHKYGMFFCLLQWANLYADRDFPDKAARLLASASVLLHEMGTELLEPLDRDQFETNISNIRADLGGDKWDAAWNDGQSLLLEQVINYALEEESFPVQPTGSVEAAADAKLVAPPVRPAGLTEREVEVLCLIAEGFSYEQVAEKLVISPRTVNTHLSAIYSKLGVNSRTAATRWAIAHKLV